MCSPAATLHPFCHPAPCTLHPAPCTRRLRPLARIFTAGSAPGDPAPTPRASSPPSHPNPSCSDRVSLPSSDLASLGVDGLYLGCNLWIQAAAPCIQAATLRGQVDAFEFNSPKPFTHASHRAEWPRLADTTRSAHSAGLEENGAGRSCIPCARGCNLGHSGCNLMHILYEAATLCLPGLEGEGEGRGENSAPPPAAAAEVEAPCQEVRRGRAGWHCCAPLHAHHTRTKRAPSAHPKHTTVRYRTTTAPHRYRCAAGALAGRARRSLTGGTRHF